MITLRSSFAAAMRMINGIHRRTAHMGSLPEPSAASGLADRDILVFDVAGLPDGGATLGQHHALFSRWEFEQGKLALLGHKLSLSTGAARQLRTFARPHFNRVDHSA